MRFVKTVDREVVSKRMILLLPHIGGALEESRSFVNIVAKKWCVVGILLLLQTVNSFESCYNC